jgi:hypothetical protein
MAKKKSNLGKYTNSIKEVVYPTQQHKMTMKKTFVKKEEPKMLMKKTVEKIPQQQLMKKTIEKKPMKSVSRPKPDTSIKIPKRK